MKNILEAISNLEDMKFIKPASTKQVEEAQKSLGVVFANDYREYVLKYGVISAKGIELTGVTTIARLDVVEETKRERKINNCMPADMYVIENIAIDGIVMVQDTKGKVYSITLNGEPEYVCESLTEYVEHYNVRFSKKAL